MLDALDDRRALAQYRDDLGPAQFDSRQPVHRTIVNARATRFKRATEAKSRKATGGGGAEEDRTHDLCSAIAATGAVFRSFLQF